jgi:hypothetical protein
VKIRDVAAELPLDDAAKLLARGFFEGICTERRGFGELVRVAADDAA